MKQVGTITAQVIQTLGLSITPDTPIYLGETNVAHMSMRHPDDYGKYGDLVEDIIANPTFVGCKNGSIEYVKEVSEYVKIAVRVSQDGLYFARTLYTMNAIKVESMVAKGTLRPLT